MTYETILYEKRGPVALITLNRPDRMNAWTRKLNDEQLLAIQNANEDVSMRWMNLMMR